MGGRGSSLNSNNATSAQTARTERGREGAIQRFMEGTGLSREEAEREFNDTVRYNMRGTGGTAADRDYAVRETIDDFMSREYNNTRQAGRAFNGNRVEVKNVNGYSITKIDGRTGSYDVQTGYNRRRNFRTIKAAEEFIRTLPSR